MPHFTADIDFAQTDIATDMPHVAADIALAQTDVATDMPHVATDIAQARADVASDMRNVGTDIAGTPRGISTDVPHVATDIAWAQTNIATDVRASAPTPWGPARTEFACSSSWHLVQAAVPSLNVVEAGNDCRASSASRVALTNSATAASNPGISLRICNVPSLLPCWMRRGAVSATGHATRSSLSAGHQFGGP